MAGWMAELRSNVSPGFLYDFEPTGNRVYVFANLASQLWQ